MAISRSHELCDMCLGLCIRTGSFGNWPRASGFEDDATKDNWAYSEETPANKRADPEAQNGNASFSHFCCGPACNHQSRWKYLFGHGRHAISTNNYSGVHRFRQPIPCADDRKPANQPDGEFRSTADIRCGCDGSRTAHFSMDAERQTHQRGELRLLYDAGRDG